MNRHYDDILHPLPPHLLGKFSAEGCEFVCPWANKEQGDPIFQKGVSLLSYFLI
ncbi:MAG: hypothetical protein IJC95_03985 [Clostridia bacterium]|nr:hypothetical protein [Clostridia bacterium]